MPSDGPLLIYTIYCGARDRIGPYTVRAFTIGHAPFPVPVEAAVDFPTLEDARASLPPGLHCLGRQLGDDPVIVETWI